MNYTFITLDCRGPILYLIISAHEPRKVVIKLEARLETLITVQHKGFHRDAVEVFAFLGCYARYVGCLQKFWDNFSALDRLNLEDGTNRL